MISPRLAILLLISLSISSSIQAATECTTVTEIPATECAALLSLYHSTHGSEWLERIVNSGWNSTNTPCSWSGIVCMGHHVVNITLSGYGLTGTIPPELGNLSNLSYLRLENNQLHSSSTTLIELGKLSNLEFLDLSSNHLSGTIPPELGKLSKLIELSLGGNHLSGAIPAELGELSNLLFLNLGGNQLNGTIPVELGKLSNLIELSLGGNHLSGAIPAELGKLSNLKFLNLGGNQLNGTIPAELGKLSNLEYLGLGTNQLSGAIPAELGKLSNLEYLNLYDNQLSGIPAELGKLSNLRILDLGANQLTGTIPTELGKLSNLVFLYLYDNQLGGAIPAELGELSELVSFTLSDNYLCGDIPPSLQKLNDGKLFGAYLERNTLNTNIDDPELLNFLDTQIPGWKNQNPAPDTCILQPTDCTIVTEIPATECAALLSLYHKTQGTRWTNNTGWNLTNTPCNWYGITCSDNHVTNIDLSENALTGQIPAELGNLSNLQFLSLRDNQLSGRIPTELGKLSNLLFLDLSANQLSGTIPDEFGQLFKLLGLYLSANNFCGNFPSSLKGLNNLGHGSFPTSSIEGNALNTVISDPELVNFLDTTLPNWKNQTPTPGLCTLFLGGVTINQGSYHNPSFPSLADQVEVLGEIKVALADRGRTADLFVYAETNFPFLAETVYYGLDEKLNIYEWDQQPAHLLPLLRNVSLAETQFITLYRGTFYYPGLLKLFFGYRLNDGILVKNSEPIVIDIQMIDCRFMTNGVILTHECTKRDTPNEE